MPLVKPFLDYNRTFCLKGLCMIMIIIHHCYTHGIWLKCHLFERLCQPVQWGYLGTGCFLFLSGFGLFVSCSKKYGIIPMPIEWFWAKMQKLLIPFIAAFVVALLIIQIYPPHSNIFMKEWIVDFCTLTIPPTTTCSIIQYVPIENRIFHYVGHNSINFYLFQMPLLYLSGQFCSIPIRFLIVFGGSFFLSYIYSNIEAYFQTSKK